MRKRESRNILLSIPENPENIAKLFNCYFFSAFHSQGSDSESENLPDSVDTDVPVLLSNFNITPEEVFQILSTLDINKAKGSNKIPALLFKNCASSICTSLSMPCSIKACQLNSCRRNGNYYLTLPPYQMAGSRDTLQTISQFHYYRLCRK